MRNAAAEAWIKALPEAVANGVNPLAFSPTTNEDQGGTARVAIAYRNTPCGLTKSARVLKRTPLHLLRCSYQRLIDLSAHCAFI